MRNRLQIADTEEKYQAIGMLGRETLITIAQQVFDTHLRRFLGADRMGTGSNSPATISEVNDQVARLSEQTGMSKVEIDNLIWSFCADGFGEVCTATPHCKSCPIADYCHGC